MTRKQLAAARHNIRKAMSAWQSMSSRQRARAQPEGRMRKKPGTGGGGDYYHITVRPQRDFVLFRTHDVGRPGHVQRVAGKRASGSWDTIKWLISKHDAHVQNGKLVADSSAAKDVISKLGSRPVHVTADRFKAQPRRNVPEADQPTAAQRRARSRNLKQALAARHAH